VGERLRSTAAQHPGRALGIIAAVAALGIALAAGATERLALSGSHDSRGALRIKVSGPLPPRAPAYRVAVRTMRTQLSVNPAVRAVRERQRGGRVTLVVEFGAEGQKRDAAIARIRRNLDPGPLSLRFGGTEALVAVARDDALDDLYLLALCLPVVALIAAGTVGVRPAAVALLAAAAASALASLLCELLGGAFDVSWLALVGAVAGGTLLSLQGCALLRAGAGPATVSAAALAAAATFGSVAALGVGYLGSIGLGGALGSLLAVPAALAATGAGDGLGPQGVRTAASRPWRAVAGLVGWSWPTAAVFALLASALLLIVAAPAQRLAVAALGAAAAPGIEAPGIAAAVAIASVLTAIAAGWAGARVWLAITATLACALPGLAVVGLLVATFQDANLEDLLGYSSNGALQLGSLAAAVAVVAALGASQAVALAASGRAVKAEEPSLGAARALGLCGPGAGLACLTAVAAGLALCAASPAFVKQFGLGVAAGAVLELLIVQAVLAPALVRLAAGRPAGQ
jgi:hypothetical protein